MADPFKQVSHRRLLPFPGTHYRLNIGTHDFNEQTESSLTPDLVKSYLQCHRDVLEDYIFEHVTTDQLEHWTGKKKNNKNANTSLQSLLSMRAPMLQQKYTELDISQLQRNLLREILANGDILPLVYEFGNVIGAALKSDCFSLYAVRNSGRDLLLYCPPHNDKESYQLRKVGQAGFDTTVSAHVAKTKNSVVVKDLSADDRFPKGIGVDGTLMNSVLSVPFVLPTEDILCVLEFCRHWEKNVFADLELELVTACISWTALAQHQIQMNVQLTKHSDLNDFLLEVSKTMFDNVVALDNLVETIMSHAKDLVEADRCTLFLVDTECSELYANLFDEGNVTAEGKPIFTKKNKKCGHCRLRIPMSKGIAGYVARTAEIVNIPEAYNDPRFNREVDRLTGYTTHSILCMPIISQGQVIGVVQMLNKRNAEDHTFTNGDESAFKTFAVYCALALHYSKLFRDLERITAHSKVAQEMVLYHSRCSEEEYRSLHNKQLPQVLPPDLDSFYFYGPEKHARELPQLFIQMSVNLLGPKCFDMSRLSRLIMTVKKNYRPVAYHNWHHGWNVAHCAYIVLTRIQPRKLLPTLWMKAIMIASLCHDVDHRGFNNTFFTKFNEPLATLYQSSVMEQHHYATTVRLMQADDHDVFADLNAEEYKQVLEYIRHAIISTDPALYFGNQQNLSKLLLEGSLDLNNSQHLLTTVALMMNACDLSAVCKPWAKHFLGINTLCQEFYQQDTISLIMVACDLSACCKTWVVTRDIILELISEFFQQGDQEKERGEAPIPLMDRDRAEHMPHDQVSFFKAVCLPCYQTTVQILPETADLLEGCKDNLSQWQRVVEGKSTEVWEPLLSQPADK